MTSSANDEWNHDYLQWFIKYMQPEISCRIKNTFEHDAIQHAIDFIEYNMRELEIHESNGD